MTTIQKRRYRPTESKYKGGAHEMYLTYDLPQKTRSGGTAVYPKVKRVYIAGEVKDWSVGRVRKKSGREVFGARIQYEQTRAKHHREGFQAERGATAYTVAPSAVPSTSQTFTQVVELPDKARDAQFYTDEASVPERYRQALQHVR